MSDLRTVPKHTALLIGLMIFGLFFGAGNLIFPVELGRLAGHSAPVTAAGFLVTAVGIPIVAIISGHTHIDVAGSVFDAVLPLPNSPSFISHLLTSLQHESSSSTHMLDEATNMALAQLAL